MQISFSWSTRREGNDGYVLEVSSTGLRHEFGPMPAHIVPAFVAGRRKIVTLRARLVGADATVEDDFGYLLDPSSGLRPTEH